MRNVLILLVFILSARMTGQNSADVSGILKEHIKEFRKVVGEKAEIAIIVDYDFKSLEDFGDREHIVKPQINPKKIKGSDNFLIKVLFTNEKGRLIVRIIDFRITKVGRRDLEFTNIGGQDYQVNL